MSDPQTTDEAVKLIEAAVKPADLFPADCGAAVKLHRRLAVLTHPDTNPAAGDVFARLEELWDAYGKLEPAVIHGDIADLFPQADKTLAKYPRQPADNDLMTAEATALKSLRDSKYPVYFPQLVSSVRQRDPGTGAVRRVNMLTALDGFYDMTDVETAYPYGLHPRDAAWMWRRLLAAIGTAQETGLVHGAVLPEHVMIHPGEHGLVLVDWCYSVPSGEKMRAIVERYRDWYPPEVFRGEPATAAMDIYMSAGLMLHMMGSKAPKQLTAFANGCRFSNPASRPDHAWGLLKEFDELLERLFGPPKRHEFIMPARKNA